MKISLILLSISFALPERVWDDFSSEESSDSNEDISLEVDLQNLIGQNVGEEENDPNFALNKCLTIKNSEKISFCVVQLCAKNCQAIHQTSGGKCVTGCELQNSIFLQTKKNYPKTKPEYLLGQALDKCWEGCDSMKLISYSDVSSCVKGCNEMRKLQKNQILQTKKDPVKTAVEKLPKGIKEDQDSKIIAQKSSNEVADTDVDGFRTFVVVRNNDISVSSDDFYISLVRLMDSLFTEVEPLTPGARPGYTGDRDQLTLPSLSRPQPQRSDNGPGWLQSAEDKAGRFLDSAEDNAGNFFQQMKTTLRSREAQEMIFYVLVCMSCFMLISALMDLCGMKNRNSEDEEDDNESCSLEYEYKTKLPSYEECMMAEPCKVKLDVEIHKAAAEKNMITM